MEKQLTIPTVHLNGSGGKSLLDGYLKAMGAISHAIRACQETAPHGRDYYVQSGHTLCQAMEEHVSRLATLQSIKNELNTLAVGIARQRIIEYDK